MALKQRVGVFCPFSLSAGKAGKGLGAGHRSTSVWIQGSAAAPHTPALFPWRRGCRIMTPWPYGIFLFRVAGVAKPPASPARDASRHPLRPIAGCRHWMDFRRVSLQPRRGPVRFAFSRGCASFSLRLYARRFSACCAQRVARAFFACRACGACRARKSPVFAYGAQASWGLRAARLSGRGSTRRHRRLRGSNRHRHHRPLRRCGARGAGLR